MRTKKASSRAPSGFIASWGFVRPDRKSPNLCCRKKRRLPRARNIAPSATTLRKLAESPMIFELDATENAARGDWDRFSVRKIGLKTQRQMAARYRGNAEKFRLAAVEKLTRALGMRAEDWRDADLPAVSDFAVALSLANLSDWSDDEKRALAQVIRAKATSDESRYLKLMQKHARLRDTDDQARIVDAKVNLPKFAGQSHIFRSGRWACPRSFLWLARFFASQGRAGASPPS